MQQGRAAAVSHDKYDRLIATAQKVATNKVAGVHPCDDVSLRGAVEAKSLGLIEPILVGPIERVRDVAAQASLDLDAMEIVASAHSPRRAYESGIEIRSNDKKPTARRIRHREERGGATF
jgi:phosphate acetyltransferase